VRKCYTLSSVDFPRFTVLGVNSLHFIHQFTVNLSDGKSASLNCNGRTVPESAMSILIRRCRQYFGLWPSVVLAVGMIGIMPARADTDTVTINVDQANIMQLPDRVATIVIGNPLIADATLQSGGVLVVTGKGFGATNLLVLDRAGRVLMSKTVQVVGPGSTDLVVVYKGVERESYSCAPNCERRITLGDAPAYFKTNLDESAARSSAATKQ
jgi:putative type II/III system pilus formation protein